MILDQMSKTATFDINTAIMNSNSILSQEKSNIDNGSLTLELSKDEYTKEILNYSKRSDALNGMIKAYREIKKKFPRLICSIFPGQCQE
ncbi:MAG: hypothetical protein R3B45_15455 [Bdellovibrionota bacterium]